MYKAKLLYYARCVLEKNVGGQNRVGYFYTIQNINIGVDDRVQTALKVGAPWARHVGGWPTNSGQIMNQSKRCPSSIRAHTAWATYTVCCFLSSLLFQFPRALMGTRSHSRSSHPLLCTLRHSIWDKQVQRNCVGGCIDYITVERAAMDFILIVVVWCIPHIELFLTKTLSIMKKESRLLKKVSKHIGFLT